MIVTNPMGLLPASAGSLLSAPSNPGQEFDQPSASLRAALRRIDELTAAIEREEAKPRPNWGFVAELQADLNRTEERQAEERCRAWGVAGPLPSTSPLAG